MSSRATGMRQFHRFPTDSLPISSISRSISLFPSQVCANFIDFPLDFPFPFTGMSSRATGMRQFHRFPARFPFPPARFPFPFTGMRQFHRFPTDSLPKIPLICPGRAISGRAISGRLQCAPTTRRRLGVD
jgi:hypothetical protein